MHQLSQNKLVETAGAVLPTWSHDSLISMRGRFLQEPVQPAPRVAIKLKKKIVFIDPGWLISVRAQGRYVAVHHSSGSYVLKASISGVAKKLASHGFVRIQRSILVNSAWVTEIKPHLRGNYSLLLKSGGELKATRVYRRSLLKLADLWF